MRKVLAQINNVIEELENEGMHKEAESMNEVFMKIAQLDTIKKFLNKNIVEPVKKVLNPDIPHINIIAPAGVTSLTQLAGNIADGADRKIVLEQLMALNPRNFQPGGMVSVPINSKTLSLQAQQKNTRPKTK